MNAVEYFAQNHPVFNEYALVRIMCPTALGIKVPNCPERNGDCLHDVCSKCWHAELEEHNGSFYLVHEIPEPPKYKIEMNLNGTKRFRLAAAT